jgi:transcriptional regulator with XRE-family HTH domain
MTEPGKASKLSTPKVEKAGERVGQAVEQVGQVVEQAGQVVGDIGRDISRDIGGYIRAQREHAQVSMRELARTAGVSNPYLSQIERGLRKPSAEILQQIAKGLRISAEALYVRAGILDEKPASAVGDAVLADPTLTERQKQVLLDVYRSFRRENGGDDQGVPSTPATATTLHVTEE